MSKHDVTTQDLLRRLGPTSRSRSAKADALFRRLRMADAEKIAEAISGAPAVVRPNIDNDASAAKKP